MRASPSAPATCTKGGVPPHELHDEQIYETHILVSSKLLSPTAYDGVLQCVRRAEHRTEYADWGFYKKEIPSVQPDGLLECSFRRSYRIVSAGFSDNILMIVAVRRLYE